MEDNGGNNLDNNSQSEWIFLDNKIANKMNSVSQEIADLKQNVDELKDELKDIRQVFKDWKVHLENSRRERLNVLEDIKGYLQENRELYMKEFINEANKLRQLTENSKKIETKLSPEYQLRRDNRSWRQFNITGYRSNSSFNLDDQ